MIEGKILAGLDTPAHLREISRKTRINVSLLHRVLKRMENCGMVFSKKDGKFRRFTRNDIHPEVREFILLEFAKNETNRLGKLEKAVMDFVFQVYSRHKNEFVACYVFGSTAKGKRKKHSDIDIMVVFKKLPGSLKKRKSVVFEFVKNILYKYSKKLDVTLYDLADLKHPDRLRKEIEKDNIYVFDKVGIFDERIRSHGI